MRRTAVFIFILIILLQATAFATTTVTSDTALPTSSTVTTPAATDITVSTDTTDTTIAAAVDGTTVPTSSTTDPTTKRTTKPTEKRVKSSLLLSEKATANVKIHGKQVWKNGRNNRDALYFDGEKTYVEIPLKASNTFTLSLWVNWQTDTTLPSSTNQRIFSFIKKNTENTLSLSPFIRELQEPQDAINGMALIADCFHKQWLRKALYHPTSETISNMLPIGMWHHIALTVEKDTVTVFVDGLQWTRQTIPFSFAQLNADTLLLGAADNGVCLFSGLMQDVKLYEKALTPQQVLRLSNDDDPFDATLTATPSLYLPVELPETVILQQTYRVQTTLTDEIAKTEIVSDPGGAFWEKPILSGGQSVTCTLILENKSKRTVSAHLSQIVLPQQDTPEWQYLSDILVSVKNGEQEIFNGRYTELTPDKLSVSLPDMFYGSRYTLKLTLSRPFTSVVGYTPITVPWTFSCEETPIAASALPPIQPLTWLIILLVVSIVVVGFSIYWLTTRRPDHWFGRLYARIKSLRQQIPTPFNKDDTTS